MRDHSHGPWGDYRHGRGFRPPWWPENEPFPPTGEGAWRGIRRHFVRRMVLMVAVFFGVTFLASAVAVALLSGALGLGDGEVLAVPAALLALGLLFTIFVTVGRGVRRMARPLGDVMEAADRVAAGDYAARVEERGPHEMRRLARSFNAMSSRLRSSEQERRNLLADVAHELRTPLSVIQGNVEGILDGVYPAEPAQLEPVLEETRVMSRLLDDLQTLSTAEAGALRLHRTAVAPSVLVEDGVAAFRTQADSEGVSLRARVAPDLPLVEVDSVRIGEVLANLLHNALTHTPSHGSVVVSAEPAGAEGVAFAVEDTGAGIPPEALPHIFDRFVKAGDSGGAGLGLAIAKSIVEGHGGHITAQSLPGQGTTMRFVLPVRSDAGAT